MKNTIERYMEHSIEDTSTTTLDQDTEYHLLKEQIAKLKVTESSLVKENALLREKCKLLPQIPSAASKEFPPRSTLGQRTEVETELRIGCPGRGTHGMSSHLYTNQ
ncbi:K-box region [Musa troglodytarum]|uniref:K-box region n=1 Tax=Musa troglodytarum TaxID=320322 RepID=A0A9E7FVX4_9LILI|nr:K-box region [Musa troglodytarum]